MRRNSKNNHGFLQGISRKWRWLIVLVYTLAIYAFLPFGPQIWIFVLRYYGKGVNYVGILLAVILGGYFLFHLAFREKVKKFYVYLAFFLISLACIVLLKYFCLFPAERLHLLMYGVLSATVFWAMKLDVSTNRIYIYTTLLVFLLGAIDETIQFLLPMRRFDVRDIMLNWTSGGLGILFISFVLRPKLQSENPQHC